jgi:UDP-glucose 4-epimerase
MENKRPMRVLITGGLGNLGSWLTEFLVNEGHEITVLASRERNVLKSLGFKFISCDITDHSKVEKALENLEFDTVIHAASSNDFFEKEYDKSSLLVNAYGTRNLVDVFSKKKELKNFIYLSTFHVYGAGEGEVDENSAVLPRNDYAITHLFGEEYVKYFSRTNSLPFTIIRLSNSYGCPKEMNSSKWYLVLNDMAKTAFETSEIIIKTNGKPSRDFVWMGDVCQVFNKLVSNNNGENETFNLSSGRNFQVLEIAKYVAAAYKTKFGKEVPIKINEKDSNVYKEVSVNSSKLQAKFNTSFSVEFENEAIKIFDLLEKNKS